MEWVFVVLGYKIAISISLFLIKKHFKKNIQGEIPTLI